MKEAPLTLVDNEHQGLGAQGVVQGNCYHGVGVAGQLANNPLRGSKMKTGLNPLQTARIKTHFYTDLRSILCKDANESVRVWLQAPVKKAGPQVLGPIGDLRGQLGSRS